MSDSLLRRRLRLDHNSSRLYQNTVSLEKLKLTLVDSSNSIKIAQVQGTILEKVVSYLKYHYNHPPAEIVRPLRSANMRDSVSEWDADFIETDWETLLAVILAANVMQIPTLLDLGCTKVASMLKGKSAEQISAEFSIRNDFTPEEEEAVRAENKWAEEN